MIGGNDLDRILWADAPDEAAAAARASLCSQATASFLEAPTRVAWCDTPSTFVRGRNDLVMNGKLIDEMSKHADRIVEWDTSHSPVLSRPDLVVDVLDMLASNA